MLLPTGSARVAVVVPCLNEAEPIGGVVREILAQQVDAIVVVDNGSTDDTAGQAAAADFVMGSRLRGRREAGSMTPQQLVAGWLAGLLLRLAYGVRFTDMSPFRALRLDRLRALGMSELTFGWNLEMQMRMAAAGWRILEVPVDHRRRRGGVSKVSGNLVAGLKAAWTITRTFLRLAISLRSQPRMAADEGSK